jgi:hypothetical protein
MPIDIQNRICHIIDTVVDMRMPPVMTLLDTRTEALLANHTASAKESDPTDGDIGIRRTEACQTTNSIADNCDENGRFENGRDLAPLSLKESSGNIEKGVDDLYTVNSTGPVINNVQQTEHLTSNLISKRAVEGHTTSSSLHKKLDQVDTSLGAIRHSLVDLSIVHRKMDSNKSRSEIETAIQNILGSIWVLLSSLHVLIRELM